MLRKSLYIRFRSFGESLKNGNVLLPTNFPAMAHLVEYVLVLRMRYS